MITGKTRLYGIVGHPIGHVRVPTAFNERFARDGLDARGVDIAVNATSVGLCDGELSFDVSGLTCATLVAEVIMKPEKTALILAAEARGCPVQQGRHMLDDQMDLMFEFMRIGALS